MGSLENTPTWAVSIVCFFFFLISFTIDAGLHHLTQFLRRRKRKSLNRALTRIKTDVPISNICIPEAMANSFLPCKNNGDFVGPDASSATQFSGTKSSNVTLSAGNNDESYCKSKEMLSLVSREGVMELKIFVSFLAVFHVIYCVLTMGLGQAKMSRWKAWEHETSTLEYQIANDPRRFRLPHQTSFGQKHLKLWSNSRLLLWPVCFLRQFSGSASKADYFTLRNGFIMANIAEGSDFNFQKFLARAFDDDFEQIVSIRFWIWTFCILFIFFSAHEFYNYYWLPFIPLAIVLIVGTKLQVVITNMCVKSYKVNSVIYGAFPVKLTDDLFWFGRPKWLLYLLQVVLIQNSFQLAFFFWTWYKYGLRSCYNQEIEDIIIRISTGILVQIICGYWTLPLYALVTQMGSGVNRAVFTNRVAEGLKRWHYNARRNLSKHRSISSEHSPRSMPATADTSVRDMQKSQAEEHYQVPPVEVTRSTTSEITEEAMQNNSNTNIRRQAFYLWHFLKKN
ncbi:MLO-like protein 12 isoform X2 [Carica papaya]|uniref:MLO-like protein 12 isoform X2 n=1 Tax=Carica papaya TaxID=3649 RepID=UPI000B8CF637|nr:MLO-like protein 12 isoform X2 [Carica papaya]